MDADWEDAIKRGDVQHVRDLLDRSGEVEPATAMDRRP